MDWEHWYEERLIELVEKIEGEASAFARDTAVLRDLLRPNSFESKLALHIEHFVGREWVFEAYQKWLDHQPDSRLFWIKGGPGVGKTAIAANLSVRMRGAIVAVWFCDGRSSALRSPLLAIRSLAFQWSLRWPDYRVRLLRALGIDSPCTAEQVQQLRKALDDIKNVFDLFRQVMVEPLQNLIWREHKFVTVIDALDEATDDEGKNELVDFLAREMGSLPEWVCFVVTSRPESAVVSRLQGFKAFEIETQDARNQQDLQTWYAQNLAQLPFMTRLPLAKQASIEALLLERSEGMMLYLKLVEQGLGEGSLTLEQLQGFKPGVPGLYANYASSFHHRFGSDYESTIKPLLRLLVDVDRKHLPLDLAMAVIGCDGEGLNTLQLRLGSFVTERIGGLELFHKTLADWLTTKSDNAFYVQPGRGKKLIYEALLGGNGATDSQQERWMEALFGSWPLCLESLFQSRFEQLSIMRRIKHDIEQRGSTDKERAQRLLDRSDKLRNANILARGFIDQFEPGARNLDATFGVSYLGVLNWWPLAHAYFVLEKPMRALEILVDVLERLRAATGQEFGDILKYVNSDCARVLRTLQRPTEACQRLLESLEILDAQKIAPDAYVSELITQIYSLGQEADPSLAQLEVYGQLLPYRLRHIVGADWVEESINLLLIIQTYSGQFGQGLPAQFEDLLLVSCRTGLGLLMEAKQFELVGAWAQRCLPLYTQVFGTDHPRTRALRTISGAQ